MESRKRRRKTPRKRIDLEVRELVKRATNSSRLVFSNESVSEIVRLTEDSIVEEFPGDPETLSPFLIMLEKNLKEPSRTQRREFNALVAAISHIEYLQEIQRQASESPAHDTDFVLCNHYFSAHFDAPIERIRKFMTALLVKSQSKHYFQFNDHYCLEFLYKQLIGMCTTEMSASVESCRQVLKLVHTHLLHVGQCPIAMALGCINVVACELEKRERSEEISSHLESIARQYSIPMDIMQSCFRDINYSLGALANILLLSQTSQSNDPTKASVNNAVKPTVLKYMEMCLGYALSSTERHIALFNGLPQYLKDRVYRSISVSKSLIQQGCLQYLPVEFSCEFPPDDVLKAIYPSEEIDTTVDELLNKDISPYLLIAGSYNIEGSSREFVDNSTINENDEEKYIDEPPDDEVYPEINEEEELSPAEPEPPKPTRDSKRNR